MMQSVATRCVLAGLFLAIARSPATAVDASAAIETVETFVSDYCLDCHNAGEAIQDVDLESVLLREVDWARDEDARRSWELTWKRIASRQMPPADAYRPDEQEYRAAVAALETVLDDVADKHKDIPAVDTLRRLTRTEYQNSIRDLLGVQVDASEWIPRDESSDGFDNITVGELSPALLSRYLTAAEKISRIAVGRKTDTAMGLNVRLPADLTQENHLPGLPLGTRGGTNIRHTFAQSGVYELAVRLTRDRDEMVEGLYRPHDLDVLVDLERRHRFHIEPPENGKDFTHVDTNLKIRLPIEAGPHDIAVTFVDQGESLMEIKRQPFDAAYNRHRHPRQQPALFEVSIVGPLSAEDSGDARASDRPAAPLPTDTPSRRHIFTVWPDDDSIAAQLVAAETILRPIVRHAFRREVTDADLETPLSFFRESLVGEPASREQFEAGIERAIASILVNPNFLFRIETPFAGVDTPGQRRAISDSELAGRMAAFLWSSCPDTELLDLAVRDRLNDPTVVREQVARMLADPRSESLVTNFAAQWLYLRNLDSVTPDLRRFPDFDENLRRAFRGETEALFRHVLRTDASVLGLLRSDFTYLNERLAKHYGVPGVVGSHFRRVDLAADARRGGLLRHGSILTVTSYATRTSPTIRGNWVLENIVGTPPPPPPPDVPTLTEKSAAVATTFKERLAQHRDNAACASCHALIDPVGFALDNFDAVGRWRAYDGEVPIDASGTLPDGTEVAGIDDLESSLVARPEMFVGRLVEKLMTFGLGRTVDHRDAAAVRKIVADAAKTDYRFSQLIQGIVASEPFRYRTPSPSQPPSPSTDSQ